MDKSTLDSLISPKNVTSINKEKPPFKLRCYTYSKKGHYRRDYPSKDKELKK